MENTSRGFGNFNARIKNQLFDNFRRFKKNNSTSKNSNALKISLVEEKYLQGNFKDANCLLEKNKILLNCFSKYPEYRSLNKRYMQRDPFAFFEEAINLYSKNNGIKYSSLLSSTESELLYLIETKESLFIFFDDMFNDPNYIFELSMIDLFKDNLIHKNLFLNLFAIIWKTGVFSKVNESADFDMHIDYIFESIDELDKSEKRDYIRQIKYYRDGKYDSLMKRIINKSKKEFKILRKEILKYAYLSNDLSLINLIENLSFELNSLDQNKLKRFIEIQYRSFDFLDMDLMKYHDRSQNHIIEYNTFQYDISNSFEETLNAYNDDMFGNLSYFPYITPTELKKDGEIINHAETLTKLHSILKLMLEIERYEYQRYRKR